MLCRPGREGTPRYSSSGWRERLGAAIFHKSMQESPPRWLERVTASGGALAAATALATDAEVCILPRTDATWVEACMAIERKAFARHEAMDIAYEVSMPGATLLCASPLLPWAGLEFGGSFGTGECVGYAVVQEASVLSSTGSRGNPFAALDLPPPSVLLSKLAVAPSLRRRGIGTALLGAVVGLAHTRRHVTVVRLHVDAKNAGAQALYEAAGFVVSGERLDNFYRPGRHAFEMVLDLAGMVTSALQPPASGRTKKTEMTTVGELAASIGLAAEVVALLDAEPLDALAQQILQPSGRPAVLARLKVLGVSRLSDRQGIANSLSCVIRQGALTHSDGADLATARPLPMPAAPAERHARAAGTPQFAHVVARAMPPAAAGGATAVMATPPPTTAPSLFSGTGDRSAGSSSASDASGGSGGSGEARRRSCASPLLRSTPTASFAPLQETVDEPARTSGGPTAASALGEVTHGITLRGALLTHTILDGVKRVENRHFRMQQGWYVLHTGAKMSSHESQHALLASLVNAPDEKDLPHGAIVGAIEISHALSLEQCSAAEPWAFGPVCNVIRSVVRLERPVEHLGALSLSMARRLGRPGRRARTAAGGARASERPLPPAASLRRPKEHLCARAQGCQAAAAE